MPSNDGINDSILDTIGFGPFTSGANVDQVNAMINSIGGLGYKWLDTSGPLTITYSFIGGNSAPHDTAEYGASGLPEFNGTVTALGGSAANWEGQQGNVRRALAVWEQYANVDFIATSETASSVGDIRFGISTNLAFPTSYAETFGPFPSDSGPIADLGGTCGYLVSIQPISGCNFRARN
jgi:hypothetical protein